MTQLNKFFLVAVAFVALGLSACASVDRSTASEKDDSHNYRPHLLDRQSQF